MQMCADPAPHLPTAEALALHSLLASCIILPAGVPLTVVPPLLDQIVAAGARDPEGMQRLLLLLATASQPLQARLPRRPRLAAECV